MKELEGIIEKILEFRRERDWDQYNDPKNIAISISLEASELLEIYQWARNPEEVDETTREKFVDIEDEVADIAIYLLTFVNDLGIDLPGAIERKMKKNAVKYPVDKARGSSKKYTEL